jgi:hypothetical protein
VTVMFEVGKRYEIRMIRDGEEGSTSRTVEKYEYPLVKFADVHARAVEPYLSAKTIRGEIVNVTSPNFISATLQD